MNNIEMYRKVDKYRKSDQESLIYDIRQFLIDKRWKIADNKPLEPFNALKFLFMQALQQENNSIRLTTDLKLKLRQHLKALLITYAKDELFDGSQVSDNHVDFELEEILKLLENST